MKQYLNSQRFYELCQAYRMAPIADQGLVTECFENLKQAILTVHEVVNVLELDMDGNEIPLTAFELQSGDASNGKTMSQSEIDAILGDIERNQSQRRYKD